MTNVPERPDSSSPSGVRTPAPPRKPWAGIILVTILIIGGIAFAVSSWRGTDKVVDNGPSLATGPTGDTDGILGNGQGTPIPVDGVYVGSTSQGHKFSFTVDSVNDVSDLKVGFDYGDSGCSATITVTLSGHHDEVEHGAFTISTTSESGGYSMIVKGDVSIGDGTASGTFTAQGPGDNCGAIDVQGTWEAST